MSLKELTRLVENHCLSEIIASLRAAVYLEIEIIEFKQQFCGNTHTNTAPSAHAGKGNYSF